MPITKAELAKQLDEAREQLYRAERRAEERTLEVEQLRQKLVEQEGATSGEKRLRFELKALDRQLRETQRDLEQTAEELAAARMDDPNEQELEARQEVRELKAQLSELNCQLQANREEMAEAYDALDRAKWGMEQLRTEMKFEIMSAKEMVRDELIKAHARDLSTRDELLSLLKEKVESLQTCGAAIKTKTGKDSSDLGGGLSIGKAVDKIPTGVAEKNKAAKSPTPQSKEECASPDDKRMRLPALPKFSGDDSEDGSAFDRWARKIDKHAELEGWSDRQKLLQFELHLFGKAERVYEVLPSEEKGKYETAIKALKARLCPAKREALLSAQLMRRRQRNNESVDSYVQDFEDLFNKSYGQRGGMDLESKALLKRDLFVQGLLLKWQEKVLSSAESFSDALHQARVAEEQERQLAAMHKSGSEASRNRHSSHSAANTSGGTAQKQDSPSQSQADRRGPFPCSKCGSRRHKA